MCRGAGRDALPPPVPPGPSGAPTPRRRQQPGGRHIRAQPAGHRAPLWHHQGCGRAGERTSPGSLGSVRCWGVLGAPPGCDCVLGAPLPAAPQRLQTPPLPAGHIHHIDNTFGFADRFPYRTPVAVSSRRCARWLSAAIAECALARPAPSTLPARDGSCAQDPLRCALPPAGPLLVLSGHPPRGQRGWLRGAQRGGGAGPGPGAAALVAPAGRRRVAGGGRLLAPRAAGNASASPSAPALHACMPAQGARHLPALLLWPRWLSCLGTSLGVSSTGEASGLEFTANLAGCRMRRRTCRAQTQLATSRGMQAVRQACRLCGRRRMATSGGAALGAGGPCGARGITAPPMAPCKAAGQAAPSLATVILRSMVCGRQGKGARVQEPHRTAVAARARLAGTVSGSRRRSGGAALAVGAAFSQLRQPPDRPGRRSRPDGVREGGRGPSDRQPGIAATSVTSHDYSMCCAECPCRTPTHLQGLPAARRPLGATHVPLGCSQLPPLARSRAREARRDMPGR